MLLLIKIVFRQTIEKLCKNAEREIKEKRRERRRKKAGERRGGGKGYTKHDNFNYGCPAGKKGLPLLPGTSLNKKTLLECI